jgi:hypothetical protein
MTPPYRLYEGRRVEPEEARKIVLCMFEKYRHKPLLIGPISLEIGCQYGLSQTEELLDAMVAEGLLRLATVEELGSKHQKGYVLSTSKPRL